MNIFVLSDNPATAAEYHCDKHVVKMILETAQMLSTAHHCIDGRLTDSILYKPTHKDHPCTKWVMASKSNYNWTWELLRSLCTEYNFRYGGADLQSLTPPSKVHKVEHSGLLRALRVPPASIKNGGLLEFAQAMPDKYKNSDAVQAYRNYYIGEKAAIAKWKCGEPNWWKP